MAENDLTLLIKLMKMTTAEDNVALVAIRKANEHIANKLNSDWESILAGKVTIIEDPFKNIDLNNLPTGPRRAPPPPPPTPQRPPPRPQPAPPPPRPQTPPPGMGSAPHSGATHTHTHSAPRGPTTVNYCSLSNGAWGLRSNNQLQPGTKISVTKKNGKVKTEWVGPLIKQSYGDYIYDIGSNPAAPKVDMNKIF